MSYKVGPIERELTQRSFAADRNAGTAARNGNVLELEYWRGMRDTYAEAARYAESMGA